MTENGSALTRRRGVAHDRLDDAACRVCQTCGGKCNDYENCTDRRHARYHQCAGCPTCGGTGQESNHGDVTPNIGRSDVNLARCYCCATARCDAYPDECPND